MSGLSASFDFIADGIYSTGGGLLRVVRVEHAGRERWRVCDAKHRRVIDEDFTALWKTRRAVRHLLAEASGQQIAGWERIAATASADAV